MKASVIIRAGDLCIHRHTCEYIGVVLETVTLVRDAQNHLIPAKCDIFWVDSMQTEEGLIGPHHTENYKIVR